MTKSHESRAGIPSMRKSAFKDVPNDSVGLCVSAVCFLHIQPSSANVRLQKMQYMPPVKVVVLVRRPRNTQWLFRRVWKDMCRK